MPSIFPTNTVVFIVATMIAAGIAYGSTLWKGFGRTPAARHSRHAWLSGAGIFLASLLIARLALAAFPPPGSNLAVQFAITLTIFGLILLAGLAPLVFSPAFRQAVFAIPQTWLVGLHSIRLAGFLFLALMDMGRLPPQFALSAGYGDMATGLLALGLVYLLVQRKPYAPALLVAWNALGLLDFVGALVTGGLYIQPFAAQLAAAGIPTAYLNYVLVVPAFGVPVYALLHIYSLLQVAAGRVKTSAPEHPTAREQPSIHA